MKKEPKLLTPYPASMITGLVLHLIVTFMSIIALVIRIIRGNILPSVFVVLVGCIIMGIMLSFNDYLTMKKIERNVLLFLMERYREEGSDTYNVRNKYKDFTQNELLVLSTFVKSMKPSNHPNITGLDDDKIAKIEEIATNINNEINLEITSRKIVSGQ